MHFDVGGEVLLDAEHTPPASRWPLSPLWIGPFRSLARTAPNKGRLDIPATRSVFPKFNFERLFPSLR